MRWIISLPEGDPKLIEYEKYAEAGDVAACMVQYALKDKYQYIRRCEVDADYIRFTWEDTRYTWRTPATVSNQIRDWDYRSAGGADGQASWVGSMKLVLNESDARTRDAGHALRVSARDRHHKVSAERKRVTEKGTSPRSRSRAFSKMLSDRKGLTAGD